MENSAGTVLDEINTGNISKTTWKVYTFNDITDADTQFDLAVVLVLLGSRALTRLMA